MSFVLIAYCEVPMSTLKSPPLPLMDTCNVLSPTTPIDGMVNSTFTRDTYLEERREKREERRETNTPH